MNEPQTIDTPAEDIATKKEAAAAATSAPRPKVGRSQAAAGKAATELPPLPPVFEPLSEPVNGASPEDEMQSEEMRQRLFAPEPLETRPWDFKFALFAVTLFVAVTLGLAAAIRHDKAKDRTTLDTQATSLSQRSKLELSNEAAALPAAAPATDARAPLLDLPSASAAPTVTPAAPAPAIPAAAANAASSVPPAAGFAANPLPPMHMDQIAVAPAAQSAEPPAPQQSASPAAITRVYSRRSTTQALLAIINKE